MIVEIEAKFSCDDCGTDFFVRLDPGYHPPDDWSVMDVAEDAIRSGLWYRDATAEDDRYHGRYDRMGNGSVDNDGRHYCARCTKIRDSS